MKLITSMVFVILMFIGCGSNSGVGSLEGTLQNVSITESFHGISTSVEEVNGTSGAHYKLNILAYNDSKNHELNVLDQAEKILGNYLLFSITITKKENFARLDNSRHLLTDSAGQKNRDLDIRLRITKNDGSVKLINVEANATQGGVDLNQIALSYNQANQLVVDRIDLNFEVEVQGKGRVVGYLSHRFHTGEPLDFLDRQQTQQ